MKIGVCGIACEICPKMSSGTCPRPGIGCIPKENPFCSIATCAYRKGMRYCFACPDFPCELTSQGPVKEGFCRHISGKD